MAFEWLQRIQQNGQLIRTLLIQQIYILHFYHPIKRAYEKRYESLEPRSVDGENSKRMRVRSTRVNIVVSDLDRPNVKWLWQGLPKQWPLSDWFRLASSISMTYVCFKTAVPGLSEGLISLLPISRPAHCYLLGRFVIQAEVSRVSGLLLSLYHVGWRCIQNYASQSGIFISVIYFLLLDNRDIERYYRLQKEQNGIERQSLKTKRLGRMSEAQIGYRQRDWDRGRTSSLSDRRERFMHDVMSFRVDYGSRTLYKLRPNRTPEARNDLLRMMVVLTVIALTVFALLGLIMSVLINLHLLKLETYLFNYPNCSPEVEQLNDRGDINPWSLRFMTTHQIVALLADFQENFFIWTECGLVAVFDIALTMLLNYDLHLYWRHLDRNIEETLRVVLLANEQPNYCSALGPTNTQLVTNYSLFLSPNENHIAGRIFELQMQFQDFIKQIDATNKFHTDTYAVLLTMWFTIFSYYSYKLLNGTSSISIVVMLALLLTVVFLVGFTILVIQRDCKMSYPKICSLMAHDRSCHKRNFSKVLEYYSKERTCFTVYRGRVLKSSTLLHFIGYSFSAFFIIGSMYNR